MDTRLTMTQFIDQPINSDCFFTKLHFMRFGRTIETSLVKNFKVESGAFLICGQQVRQKLQHQLSHVVQITPNGLNFKIAYVAPSHHLRDSLLKTATLRSRQSLVSCLA